MNSLKNRAKQFLFLFLLLAATLSASSIKAIIFDCDGTLIDNNNGYFLVWQHALKTQGYELDVEEFWEFMHKNNLVGAPSAESDILHHYCRFFDHDCAYELKKEAHAFVQLLNQNYPFPPLENTVQFLQRLKKEQEQFGFKLALASGGSREHIFRILKKLKLESYFDLIVSGADDLADYQDLEGTNKPKPYIYLHAAKLLGVPPHQCVAIEDSAVGVVSAAKAGCLTIAIPNRHTCRQDFSFAHLKIDSFEGIEPIDFLQMISVLKNLHHHFK